MNIKKLTVILLAVTILLLAACGKGTPSDADKPDGTDKPAPSEEPSDSSEPSETAEPTPEATPEPVTIVYGDWGDKDWVRERMQPFMDRNPHITVEVDPDLTWPWTENLIAAAAAQKLPDVFVVNEVPAVVLNKLTYDMTPLLEADEDFTPDNIYENLLEVAKVNGKYYTLPCSAYAQLVVINKTMLENENIEIPSPDWTLDEFIDICVRLTQPSKNQYALEYGQILTECLLPNDAANLTDYGWDFDAEKFSFTHPSYSKYFKLANDLIFNKKVSIDHLSEDEAAAAFDGRSPYVTGQAALYIGYAWDIQWFLDECDFEFIVRPVPKINQQRMKIVSDYIAISSVTKHPEAAYELVKYLSFSDEGWLDYFSMQDTTYYGFPLVKSENVWKNYLAQDGLVEGMDSIIELMPNSFPDGYRLVAGYSQIWEEVYAPNITDFFKGVKNPDDFVAEMEENANRMYQEAAAALKAVN
jgi:multiple sugar transport system substrate-binding protein